MQNISQEKVSLKNFKGLNTEEAREARVAYLKSLGMNTKHIEKTPLSASLVKSNIESYVGTYAMPLGLVGPISMQHEDGDVEEIFTLAGTTEGALVASMNRGAGIIRASGGFKAYVQKQRMLRAPVFCFDDLYRAKYFAKWIQEKFSYLQDHIKKYSARAQLVEIKTNLFGRNVDCKFYYETADAAGQNMTTICTWHCCLWIEKEFNSNHDFQIQDFVLEGNGASDKKLSYSSIQSGRGIDVVAECIIPEELLRKRLKVSSDDIIKWMSTCSNVTNYDGMVGNNINVSNAITALFLSTGQDLACLAESTVGFLAFEPHSKGLYASLKLPKLVIGTVGGGTGLPDAKAILELMGCAGSGKVNRLAKLIAGFTLGLEISTISAMISGQFAIAHERLGRNKPVDFLKLAELDNDFFKNERFLGDNQVIQFVESMNENNGIITEISSKNSNKFIGLSLWKVTRNNESELAILKSKPTADETLNCMYMLTGLIDPKLAKKFMLFQDKSEFYDCHKRELDIYKHLATKKSGGIPKIYGTYSNDERESYLVLMESLRADNMKLLNSENNISTWKYIDVKNTIDSVTKLHQELGDLDKSHLYKHEFVDYADFSWNSIDVLENEYGQNYAAFIDLLRKSYEYVAQTEDEIYSELPIVVVHNDFNPRNVAISKSQQVYIYDWELACIDIPHRDLIEMYLFVRQASELKENFRNLCEDHHLAFQASFNKVIDTEAWNKGYKFAFAKYLITRLNFYLLGNKLSRYEFLDYVIPNTLEINREVFDL